MTPWPQSRGEHRTPDPVECQGLVGPGTTTVRQPALNQAACTGVAYPVESKGRERLRVERKEAVRECLRGVERKEAVRESHRGVERKEAEAGFRQEVESKEEGCRREVGRKEVEEEAGFPVASRDRRTAVARGLRSRPQSPSIVSFTTR